MGIALREFLLVFLLAAIVVVPSAKICRPAGFPAWFGVGAIVPGVNIVLLYFVAFARWPGVASGDVRD